MSCQIFYQPLPNLTNLYPLVLLTFTYFYHLLPTFITFCQFLPIFILLLHFFCTTFTHFLNTTTFHQFFIYHQFLSTFYQLFTTSQEILLYIQPPFTNFSPSFTNILCKILQLYSKNSWSSSNFSSVSIKNLPSSNFSLSMIFLILFKTLSKLLSLRFK